MDSGPDPDAPILDSHVIILPDALAATATVSATQLDFPSGDPLLETVEVGSILASGYQAGFLQKVTGISKAAGRVTFATQQASLTEAVIQGELTLEPVASTFGPLKVRRQPLTIEGPALGLSRDGEMLVEESNLQVELEKLGLTFTPSIDVSLSIKNGHVQEFHVIAQGNFQAQVSLKAHALLGVSRMAEHEVFVMHKYQLFFIGALPVVIDNAFTITAKASVEIGGMIDVTAGESATSMLRIGAAYDGASWSAVADATPTATPLTGTLSASLGATATASLEAKLASNFYAVAGPAVTLEPSATLKLDLTADQCSPSWSLEGGLKSQLEAKFEIGEWTIASYDTTLFEKTWPLAAQNLADAGCSDGGMDAGAPDGGASDGGGLDAGAEDPDAGTVLDAGATPTAIAECVRGFAWQHPAPLGGTLTDLWTWGSELWAVTSEGGVYRSTNLTDFTLLYTAPVQLNALWGSSPSDVWVVGFGGEVLHYDGMGWTQWDLGLGNVSFRGVHGASPTDVWLVGSRGTVVHYNGQHFIFAASPLASTDDASAVWTSGSTTYVVGRTVSGTGFVLRYDGHAWSTLSLPNVNAYVYSDVWGSGPDDLWVVGTDGSGGVLQHWKGGVWGGCTSALCDMTTPCANGGTCNNGSCQGCTDDPTCRQGSRCGYPSGNGSSLSGLLGLGAHDLWVSGSSGAIAHYDGTDWTLESLGAGFRSLARMAETGGVILGTSGVQLYRRTGMGAWSGIINTPFTGSQQPRFSGVWTPGATDTWAVPVSVAFGYSSGGAFTSVALPSSSDAYAAVSGLPSGFALAVGFNGAAARFQTGAWSSLSSGVGVTLNAVHVRTATDAWAVGAQGKILRWNGSMWQPVTSPVTTELTGVYALADNNAWAVGAAGVLRWDGMGWSVDTVPDAGAVAAVWASGPGDVWAVGNGVALRFDGGSWGAAPAPSSPPVAKLFGTGPNDLWAVGDRRNTLAHWDGGSWCVGTLPANVADVTERSPGEVWVVGESGAVLRK